MRVFILVFILATLLILMRFYPIGQNKIDTSTPTGQIQDLLLPDLKLSLPQQLYIAAFNGTKKIRFSTSFINQGRGPLEVLGRNDPVRQKTKATQKILKADGSVQNQDIGEFIFHSGHDHWHIENYTIFELWSLKDNNRDQLLATTNKMSFCLWDEQVYDLTLENAARSQKYVGCNNEVQGVSVGWSDTYDAATEGQELDLTNISDGTYLIRSIINPDKKILESDYSNNEVNLRVEIRGESLVIQNVV